MKTIIGIHPARIIDDLKTDNPFAAGALAFAMDYTADSYGPHFGMRSTNDVCRAAFKAGWLAARENQIRKAVQS